MAQTLFQKLLEENTPPVNPVVMTGLAGVYIPQAENYLKRVLRNATGFPDGFQFTDVVQCTPLEEFLESTKDRNNKRTYDLAESSIRMMKISSKFREEKLPDRHISIPFCDDVGRFKLGGSLYHFTPVLSDKVLSPGTDSIFVRLLKDKIIFKRSQHGIIVDGRREINYVIWADIYRSRKTKMKVPATTKAETSIVHYLFAKYGVTQTFKKYVGFVPIFGGAEINETTYPSDKWVICQSSEIKPKTFIYDAYTPTTIRIAVPRENWDNMSKGLVVGFFYIVDHFPTRMKVEFIDNIQTWMILLGHIIWSGSYGEGKLYNNVADHFVSLSDYVDPITQEKLAEINFHVTDFYDLMALLIKHFNQLILENDNSVLSMHGKTLEVLYYAMYDITYGIFRTTFKLGKMAGKRPVEYNDIKEAFAKNLKPGAVFGLASRIVAESLSYPGDHYYPKITSKIVEQEGGSTGARGRKRRLIVGPNQHLDVSMIESGSPLFLSKSNPTPTNRINPYCQIDIGTGTILPNPALAETLKKTKELLKNGLKDS